MEYEYWWWKEDKYQIKELQELGYNISKNGTITRENIESAFDIIKNGYLKYSIFGLSSNRENIPIPFLNKYCNYTRDNVIGYFVIKAPDGSYAMCIYNDRQNLSRISKLEKGEYLSVSNHPGFFREGNETFTKEDMINQVIKLDGTDTWGHMRKDILSYLIEAGSHALVHVYGTYDNGKLINRKSLTCPDDIIFNNTKFINSSSLPIVPDKIFIGDLIL